MIRPKWHLAANHGHVSYRELTGCYAGESSDFFDHYIMEGGYINVSHKR